jgi:hypothetical protein
MAGLARRTEYTVLHAPNLESLAQDIASQLEGTVPVLCTSGLLPSSQTGLCWDAFPSGDPNIKVRIDTVRDKHVVLVMNHDTMHLFEQMAVLLFLQRFNVPHADAEYARGAWKRTICDGRYDECSVAGLTVIVPWYRHCQMERTSRWTLTDQNKWDNAKPDGEFLDVPTAQSFAAMLSSLPIPGHRPAPPQQLLLIDIHEYDDLEITLDSSHRWANRKRPYDFDRGTGTYFASAFEHFLKHVLHGRLTDVGSCFVVFPDKGAHRRFYTMVRTALGGEIALSNILWIEKSRVGADIVQADHFLYLDEHQAPQRTESKFPDGARVLIADDFTNSGGTLLGAAKIVRSHCAPGGLLHVSAYVSHFVATYDRAKVATFVGKLYATDAPLDEFHCSDSIPTVVRWLVEECDARVRAGAPRKAHVMPLGAMLAAWVQTNPLGPPGRTLFRRASGARPQGLSPNQRRQLMSAKSGVDSPRKWRPPLSDRLVEMNLSVAAAVGVGILALGMAIGKRMS